MKYSEILYTTNEVVRHKMVVVLSKLAKVHEYTFMEILNLDDDPTDLPGECNIIEFILGENAVHKVFKESEEYVYWHELYDTYLRNYHKERRKKKEEEYNKLA